MLKTGARISMYLLVFFFSKTLDTIFQEGTSLSYVHTILTTKLFFEEEEEEGK